MPDFEDRFGDAINSDGHKILSPDRTSIVTSLLSAGTFL